MSKIFNQGHFWSYAIRSLDKARGIIEQRDARKKSVVVFISHKHDELDDLKGLIGFLENEYDVECYIDSEDEIMPSVTSSITSRILKERIKRSDKFILLATNGAIESKWCNWELGFGDASKTLKNVALLPMQPAEDFEYEYKGNEYLSLYPYIRYFSGYEIDSNGKRVSQGYYVVNEKINGEEYLPLKIWLDRGNSYLRR